MAKTTSSGLKRASSNGTPIAAATTTAVAAPAAGRHLEIRKLVASNGGSTATWVHWQENSGSKYYSAYLTQGQTKEYELVRPWEMTAATALEMVTSAAGSVEYTVEYYDVNP